MVQMIAGRAGDGEFVVDLQNAESKEEKIAMFAGEENINSFLQ